MSTFDRQLDTRGLTCPHPIVRARKVLGSLNPGQVLRVICTDPASVVNFSALATRTEIELLECSEANGEFHFLLKKI